MTQQPSAGVRLKLIQTALSQLTLIGVNLAEALIKTNVPMLTAKFVPSPGQMTHLIWILRTKILTQCADASKKDNQSTILMAKVATA